MADVTKIEWCHHTFNPWIGCTKVSPGCKHCYAEADQAIRRGRVVWGANGTRSRTSDANWKTPLKWNRDAQTAGERRRVFCASLADVFEDWNGTIVDHKGYPIWRCPGLPDQHQCFPGRSEVIMHENGGHPLTMDDMRADLFRLIDQTPWLDWMLLTKRPENIRQMWQGSRTQAPVIVGSHRQNVWLGCSVSDQPTADAAIPNLLACRDLSPCLFVSYEPATGPVDFTSIYLQQSSDVYDTLSGEVTCANTGCLVDDDAATLDFVIVGGESGPNARPCNIEWIRDTVQQCESSGVACFVKQLGSNPIDNGDGSVCRVTDPKGGNPKGGNPDEWPKEIQVRQIPETTQGSSK